MFSFSYFLRFISISYIFFNLILSRIAICENIQNAIPLNFENQLNQRNYSALKKYFDDVDQIKFKKDFLTLIEEFPNVKWKIKKLNSKDTNKQKINVKVYGSKILNDKKLKLESNFNFLFSLKNGIIKNSYIYNHLTTIRNDNNSIDIDISIPNEVLSGSKYDLDIILNKPLEGTIIAGGITEHQEGKLFNQSISLEPLATGGIFKMTRAPLKAGTQIWTGLIAHPEGIISFTKSVNIVE